MTIDPALSNLITELGARMGLPNLALDADLTCALGFDRRSVVNIQYRPDRDALWFFADLGVPAAGEAAYEDLLRGNFFWRSTLGATLSLSGDQPPHVILALSVAWRGLDGARLAKQLESFVNTTEDWSEVIADPGEGRTAASESLASSTEPMTFIRI
ncbi:type III secretion system chaperone [Prosthecodimorpha staleyi]|uniref:Type III secretion system chaperone n=1 Tax=Prosthecodimorpha staleyi TaxID=2840188 RepID=A0A947D8H9_9HYPH|nr:type III secretion system chaperone [Prosthecodimorpha staleyi]MBT9292936.1 type III secretion system chaperone [Prosthecodimorpha staleyi]